MVRLTDRPDMTLDVYRGRKTTIQQLSTHVSYCCRYSWSPTCYKLSEYVYYCLWMLFHKVEGSLCCFKPYSRCGGRQTCTRSLLRFGFPDQIHTDQGREFESDLCKSICNLLGIEKTRTCAYNAKSDGMVERFNRTLVAMLFMFVDENRSDWDDHLPYVMAAYRATQHKSTGLTPNLLMLNREIDCPLDLMVGLPPGTETIE